MDKRYKNHKWKMVQQFNDYGGKTYQYQRCGLTATDRNRWYGFLQWCCDCIKPTQEIKGE